MVRTIIHVVTPMLGPGKEVGSGQGCDFVALSAHLAWSLGSESSGTLTGMDPSTTPLIV